MIIDVHSHAWEYPRHFGPDFRDQATTAWGRHDLDLTVRFENYARHSSEEVKTIVFGGKAKLSGLWVEDDYVADYVARHRDNLIGFLSIDPTQEGWRDDLERGHRNLKLRGIKLLSMYAGFRPCDPELDDLWSYATRYGLPVLLHTGTTFVAQAPLKCTLPRHLDDVAIRYPDVELRHQYVDSCALLVATNPKQFDVLLSGNLFGDIISDEAGAVAGSLGLLPSASLGDRGGLYEPVHGSAPTIAGQDIANPIGAIASGAMLLRHSLGLAAEADAIDRAIGDTLVAGHRTADLVVDEAQTQIGGAAMAQQVLDRLES